MAIVPLRRLLIYRLAIFNALCLAGVAYLWWRGLVAQVYAQDATFICAGATALFAAGSAELARRAWRTSRDLDALKAGDLTPRLDANLERAQAKAETKVAWLGDLSGWLVGLGLVGTVVGFVVALSGVDQDAMLDVSGVERGISQLVAGMRIALNTTLVGAVLGLWHEVNWRMLRTAQACYWLDRRDV